MDIRDKNILVIGLGISGISTVKALDKLGANIYITDDKTEEELNLDLEKIEGIKYRKFFGNKKPELKNLDYIVKNPGVPFDHELILKAHREGIEVMTDLELAYRLGLTDNLIVITGTNGKTTTTSLVGEIFKNAGKKVHIIGNIGLGILWELVNGNRDDIAVVEASSFQLDACSRLKPKVSSILNITPDHLNWHKTYENYVKAKKNVVINQGREDYSVLNFDDLELKEIGEELESNVFWFSIKEELERGVYLDGDYLYLNIDGERIKVININELNILGSHNVENAASSIAIAYSMGIDIDTIAESLKKFKAVPHRIEYIDKIDGISFYNDSKGTNIDASIKAVEAVDKNIILIAGGADKGCSYDEFIESFPGRVKELILLGETKYDIEKTARQHGFNSIKIVDDMKEAVRSSFALAKRGDNILLSPACASLDMYSSFEARGEDFRRNVLLLKEG